MGLSDALKHKMLDVRLRDKLLSEGAISEADVENFLKSLEDDGGNLTYTEDDQPASETETTTTDLPTEAQ